MRCAKVKNNRILLFLVKTEFCYHALYSPDVKAIYIIYAPLVNICWSICDSTQSIVLNQIDKIHHEISIIFNRDKFLLRYFLQMFVNSDQEQHTRIDHMQITGVLCIISLFNPTTV